MLETERLILRRWSEKDADSLEEQGQYDSHPCNSIKQFKKQQQVACCGNLRQLK